MIYMVPGGQTDRPAPSCRQEKGCLNVKEVALGVLGCYEPAAVAPGLTERLHHATGVETGHRTMLAPQYLTDLGVRNSADPRRFWTAHLEMFGWNVAYDPADNAAWLGGLTGDAAIRGADHTVLLVGDFAGSAGALGERVLELVSEASPAMLTRLGVLLAATADERALTVFDAVASRGTLREAIMATHRRAATMIKRGDDLDGGIRVLDELGATIARAASDGIVTDADVGAVEALLSNLRALALVRRQDTTGALGEIARAKAAVQGAGDVVVTPAEAERYWVQIMINEGQLALAAGDHEGANRVFGENVEFCRSTSSDDLSEALSANGVGEFRSGLFGDATTTLVEAAELICSEASPVRLEIARKLLATVLAKDGRSDQGCRVMFAMRTDELGFWGAGVA